MRKKKGFTLVELLVVIGIIAVLVAILLPSLNAARRQAASVKCLSNLRQLGMAARMYAEEFKGASILARIGGTGTDITFKKKYELFGTIYGTTVNTTPPYAVDEAAYWMDFLAHYLSRYQGSAGNLSLLATGEAKKAPWWCPSWTYEHKPSSFQLTKSDVDYHFSGYSMNYMPSFRPNYPPQASPLIPPSVEWARIELADDFGHFDHTQWNWPKLNAFHPADQHALIGDCTALFLEAKFPPPTGLIPGQSLFSGDGYSASWGGNISNTGQTTFDFYRHGTYPSTDSGSHTDSYKNSGGKIAYNVLFADGHVATLTTREDGYKAIRQRFPG